ncbi:MAG: HD domain-containing protein [Candidatus Daviesbacteria bacterium]
MEYKLPKEVEEILEKVSNAGFEIYIVGGAVRDLLMGSKVRDWDFTTDAKPEEILKIFPDAFYDNKFGTVGVIFARGDAEEGSLRRARNESSSEDGRRDTEAAGPRVKDIYEITTMRKEGVYQDFRHPLEVSWTNKIKEDLGRRDFTINTLALSKDGKIIDPFGGQKDLEAKLIKAVGDPNERFKEDALRLMRAIRIAAELGFDIEKNTFEAIKKNTSLIKEVSGERIRDELFKILESMNPYTGIVKLREAGILQIILPEVEKTFGISQEGPKHARTYDIGKHSLETVKETPSSDPLVRFAALIHDIGKPSTYKIDEKGNVTFYNHDVAGGQLSLRIAQRLALSKKQTDKLFKLVRWHLYTVDENQTDAAIRRFIKNVGLENIDDMLKLRIGDRLGGGTQRPVSWRMEKFSERIKEVLKKPFSISDLKVNGNDVMKILNIPAGPKVGEILNQLFQEVLDDSSKNNREYLLKLLKSLK